MKKFIWAYITCFVIVITFLWMYLAFSNRLTALKNAEDITLHSYHVINTLEKIENTLLDAETGQRGFLITGDSSFIKSYAHANKKVIALVDTLKILVGDNIMQANKVVLLKATIHLRFNYLFETLEKKKMNDAMGQTEKFDLGKQAMLNYKSEMQNIRNTELNLLAKRKTEKETHEALTLPHFKFMFITSFLLLVTCITIMLYQLHRRISYQKALENKITELNIKNEELEQYTFVTSHALQEPLRKIRIFGSMLTQMHHLSNAQAHAIERMEKATSSMQHMLTDLIIFTNLVQKKETAQLINLNVVVTNVLDKLDAEQKQHIAEINIGELPTIFGIAEQLELLFLQLFNNSIKFRSSHRPLTVTIIQKTGIAKILKPFNHYYTLLFIDNGVGFDNKYSTKIFQLFQKLDISGNVPGKGTGLTICKKIMLNHNGLIEAESSLDEGTSIILRFPKA